MRMRHVVMCGMSGLLYSIFPRYLINDIFLEKTLLNIKYVVIFSTTFVWNISHSEKNWMRYDKKMRFGPHVKYPLDLSDFNETWIFCTDFREILGYQI